MAREPVRVLITGVAGHVAYALVCMIARGLMLGPNQPIILHMLDMLTRAGTWNSMKMDLVDAALPLLKGVVVTTDVVEACTAVNIAVMIGDLQRKEGIGKKGAMTMDVSVA